MPLISGEGKNKVASPAAGASMVSAGMQSISVARIGLTTIWTRAKHQHHKNQQPWNSKAVGLMLDQILQEPYVQNIYFGKPRRGQESEKADKSWVTVSGNNNLKDLNKVNFESEPTIAK